MQNLHRKFSVIDTDVHPMLSGAQVREALPEPWRSRWAKGQHGAGHGYMNPSGGANRTDAVTPEGKPIAHDPHSLSKYFFDEMGLEYGILNPAELAFGLLPNVDYTVAIAKARNDVLIEQWLPVDERFYGSLVVSALDPQEAAKEIRRVGSHPRIAQVLMASAARMPYGQKFYWPLYEAAQEMDLPVAIHPGTESAGVSWPSTPAGYATSYFEWHSGLAMNYIAHLISLLLEGVFVKFPKLKFVLIEGGVCWLPPLLWRLDKNWKGLRIETPWLEEPPSYYAHRHIFLTTQPIEEPENPAHFKAMLEMFPSDKMLMFSTDFPHWDGDTPDFTGRLLPKELLPRVMSETARELYKLPSKVKA